MSREEDRIFHTPEMLGEEAVPAPKDFSIDAYSKSVFQMYDTDRRSRSNFSVGIIL